MGRSCLQIDFVAETFYGSDVVAKITAARAGNSSLTILCEMFQQDRLTVKGKAVLVYMTGARQAGFEEATDCTWTLIRLGALTGSTP